MHNLFIGYTCKSSIAVSNLDVIMDATRFSMELLGRNGRIEAILLSVRKINRKVRNDGLIRNATSTYICRLAVDPTDAHWSIFALV